MKITHHCQIFSLEYGYFMGTTEDKRLHLTFIQDTIKRMAGNSFLLKGWSITLIIAITSIAIGLDVDLLDGKITRLYFIGLSIFLVLIFWVLDAYYLSQERAYRGLYGKVSKTESDKIDYSMDARSFLGGNNSWFSSMFSHVFLVFYGSSLFLLLLVLGHMIGIDIYLK